MLRLALNRAQARRPTADFVSVASQPATGNFAEHNQLEAAARSCSDDALFGGLALAERRVTEINANLVHQRGLIEQLAEAGEDITSAEIMLDSLLVSLFVAAEDRHRLRALMLARSNVSHFHQAIQKL